MLQAASRHALKRDRLRPSARGAAAGAVRFFCMDDGPIISRELRMVPANAALETLDLGPPAGSASAPNFIAGGIAEVRQELRRCHPYWITGDPGLSRDS